MSSKAYEQERLKALKELAVLDTPAEKVFDDLVALAADFCETPYSLVSLVDDSRQWFKAKFGLQVESTPRSMAFCAHAILKDEIMIVKDAQNDERFHQNPLVTGSPFIRFYAGVPLILNSGHRIGTLCVIDTSPRTVNKMQEKFLSVLALQVVKLLEIRLLEAQRVQAFETIERQKLQIMETSKMSALGEMAAGVAHEINNPLGIIMGQAGRLLHLSEKGQLDLLAIKKVANNIEATSLRIAKIVKALRSFARDGEDDPAEDVALCDIFEEALNLCQQRIEQAGIKLNVHMPPPDVRFFCKSVQITQVLLNLLCNSLDAIENLEEKWINFGFQMNDHEIKIIVTDSGKGIDPGVRPHLMKPFFTTKSTGKGTGLGLSISQRIIDAHQGKFTLNEESPNTEFIIELPKLKAA